jgi:hypothetical protein
LVEVQDGDLERIATLNLTALHLDCELVSNAGVRALSSQRRLVTLSLGSEQKPLTRVTDQGLRTMLNGTTALQELVWNQTYIERGYAFPFGPCFRVCSNVSLRTAVPNPAS